MALAWNIIDPTDSGILENLSKQVIRDGEKGLMLAILENAIEDCRKYVLATDKKGKGLFDAAEVCGGAGVRRSWGQVWGW